MLKRGPILLAGILAGILPCGVATSQTSTALNNQVQLGDVFSQQTLNVETVTDSTTANTTATANVYAASTDGGDLDVRSNQTSSGDVVADTVLNVAANSGAATNLTTTASGNLGDASIYGGTLTGVFTQATTASTLYAHSHIEAPNAQTGDVATSAQAVGNNQNLGVSVAAAGVRVNQANAGTAYSDGGGVYGLVTGTAEMTAGAMGNNVSLSGDGGSGVRMIADQQNTAANTHASHFTAFGQVQDAKTTAVAAGNNLNVVNEGYLLDATVNQGNQAYVRAQAESSAANFGAGAAVASGVGNSAVMGDIGGEVIIDNTQFNEGGGIEAVAAWTGGEGYDGLASATATGNSALGYSCSDCSGRLTVANSQTNTVDVGATATATMTTGRSVSGVANAVGNTATYYVSRPGE
ncbi:holdfast anchor protein HfaD [Phenylobacterium sp.]|uniref:holdfast anchor protein HfaD n=1 Tax=Phenylobacterium sp. TaxID=1871053 RepID=UPI0027223EC4|nr:holdfast anchor protein HfaD [Phenylobacterium sp.]MDO8379989.1 holdfast anchor protein HfaD [Phenylobacterium sp.]